jgi:hypothetical protein|tara:strand:- start:764 stop:916 length:153 start_codon:yes stop_codon:yes gene_type:complete
MALYAAVKGMYIRSVASDPSNPIAGEMWYNTTSETLKCYNGTSTTTVTAT